MHYREITCIVKTDNPPKTQLIVQTKCSFCCHLRETYVKTKIKVLCKHNAKARFETYDCFWIFIYKVTHSPADKV